MNDVTERLRRLTEGRDPAALVGLAASAAWVALVLLFWLLGPEGSPASGLGRLLALAGVILPLCLEPVLALAASPVVIVVIVPAGVHCTASVVPRS